MSRIVPYAFYSVKGGVGKSSLAVAAALGFARAGRPVAVLDADFSGTSLADGLRLCAPDVVSGGRVRWRGPSRLLSLEETLARTDERRRAEHELGRVRYLDDILFGRVRTFDPQAVAWRHPEAPTIQWFPTCPQPSSVIRNVRQIFGGGALRFVRRLGEVVVTVARGLGQGGVVLIDLPTGFFGVPTAVARVLGEDRKGMANLVPVLVTTADRDDLYRSVDEFLPLRLDFGNARWMLNRNEVPLSQIREDVRSRFPPRWQPAQPEKLLFDVGYHPVGLGDIFRSERLAVPESQSERVLKILEDR